MWISYPTSLGFSQKKGDKRWKDERFVSHLDAFSYSHLYLHFYFELKTLMTFSCQFLGEKGLKGVDGQITYLVTPKRERERERERERL